MLVKICLDSVLGALGVLGGDQQLLDRHRTPVAIADADLSLAVRPQVGERAVLANIRQSARQAVGQRDRQRHQLRRLVGGIAEHHPLIAGSGRVELVARPVARALLEG